MICYRAFYEQKKLNDQEWYNTRMRRLHATIAEHRVLANHFTDLAQTLRTIEIRAKVLDKRKSSYIRRLASKFYYNQINLAGCLDTILCACIPEYLDQEFKAIMGCMITEVYYSVALPPANDLLNFENLDNAFRALDAFRRVWSASEKTYVHRDNSIHFIRALRNINKTNNLIEVTLLKIQRDTDFI
jgi:hypothetical protein